MIHSFTKILEYDFQMFLEMCVPGITDCTVALVVFSKISSFQYAQDSSFIFLDFISITFAKPHFDVQN